MWWKHPTANIRRKKTFGADASDHIWRDARHIEPSFHSPDCHVITQASLCRTQRATPRRREMDVTNNDDHPHDEKAVAQPRAEQFDALVRELYPKIRQLSPHLSPVEALRAATRMAEYRMDDEAIKLWGIR